MDDVMDEHCPDHCYDRCQGGITPCETWDLQTEVTWHTTKDALVRWHPRVRCPMCAERERIATTVGARIKELTDAVDAGAYNHYGATEPGSVDWETVAHIECLRDTERIVRGES